MSENGHGDINELNDMAVAQAEHRAFEGATVRQEEFEKEDGILAKNAANLAQTKLGVLLRSITAFPNDDDYRHILKLGCWKNPQKAGQAAKAIAECRLIGYTDGITQILDDVSAKSGGANLFLLQKVIDAIMTTNFNTNSVVSRSKWPWQKNGNDSIKNNVLS